VALTVLSGTLLSLAAATAVVATMSRTTEAQGQQIFAAAEASGRLAALPWASLPSSSSCQSIAGDVELEECVTVETVASNHKRFTVVVSSDSGADTVVVERRRTANSNPFNVP
jgi:hypothetical protein